MKKNYLGFLTLTAVLVLLAAEPLSAAMRSQIFGETDKEREIRWVWRYVHEFALSCAAGGAECQTGEIKPVAEQLASYAPEWQNAANWEKLLEFVSEKKRPDIFKSDSGEAHRVAVTDTKRGSKVYINTDRMDLPLGQWVGLLAHEAVHHLGYDDGARRLPDLVGAAVAAHFAKQMVSGSLEEFNHPETRVVIFNSRAPGRVPTAYYAVPKFLSDLEMGPTPTQALCENGERVKAEEVTPPFWRVSRIQYQRGEVSLRAGSTAAVLCVNETTKTETVRGLAFIAEADLLYGKPLTPEMAWWTLPSTIAAQSLASGLSDSPAELITRNRAFAVVSMTHEKDVVQAGGVWKTRVILRSLMGRKPIKCDGYFSGAHWAFHRFLNLSAIDSFDSCQLKELPDATWQVDLSTTIPANTQPDSFFIPLLRLSEAETDLFALPKRPQYIKVANPNAKPPLQVSGWRVLNLEPLNSFKGTPLKNSYVTDIGQPFWLEVDVTGDQQPLMGYVELKLIVNYNDTLVLATTTIRTATIDGTIILKAETVKTEKGSRIRYLLNIPGALPTHDIRGFVFSRFYVQTDDHAWPELFTSGMLEGWVIDRHSLP